MARRAAGNNENGSKNGESHRDVVLDVTNLRISCISCEGPEASKFLSGSVGISRISIGQELAIRLIKPPGRAPNPWSPFSRARLEEIREISSPAELTRESQGEVPGRHPDGDR